MKEFTEKTNQCDMKLQPLSADDMKCRKVNIPDIGISRTTAMNLDEYHAFQRGEFKPTWHTSVMLLEKPFCHKLSKHESTESTKNN